MLSDFLYAFGAVIPIFVVAMVGYLLKQKNFLTDEFVNICDKLVFRVMLPCLLFSNVAYINIDRISADDLKTLVFCAVAAPAVTAVLMLVTPLFIKDRAKTGAFIQGVFRSNVAFLGIPFATGLFGDDGTRLASIVLAVIVPIYNVLAVTVLCTFSADKEATKKPLGARIKDIIVGIAKNPLVIAIVAALPFGFLGLNRYIPEFVTTSIQYFSKASTTLALITIGASFSFSELKGRINIAACAAFLKTVVLPALFMFVSHQLLGFEGVHLGIVLIVFGTPTAISSYIMAKNMHSDASLANQIVLLSTLCCMFTIFFFSFALRRMGLI